MSAIIITPLAGRVAVITGPSSGIGEATTERTWVAALAPPHTAHGHVGRGGRGPGWRAC